MLLLSRIFGTLGGFSWLLFGLLWATALKGDTGGGAYTTYSDFEKLVALYAPSLIGLIGLGISQFVEKRFRLVGVLLLGCSLLPVLFWWWGVSRNKTSSGNLAMSLMIIILLAAPFVLAGALALLSARRKA